MPEKGTTSDCTSTAEPPKSHMFKNSRGHHTKAELASFSYYVEVHKLYRNLQLLPLAALYYLTMVVFGFCKDSFSTSRIRKLNRTHHSGSAVSSTVPNVHRPPFVFWRSLWAAFFCAITRSLPTETPLLSRYPRRIQSWPLKLAFTAGQVPAQWLGSGY